MGLLWNPGKIDARVDEDMGTLSPIAALVDVPRPSAAVAVVVPVFVFAACEDASVEIAFEASLNLLFRLDFEIGMNGRIELVDDRFECNFSPALFIFLP